jgi:AraC family transcriptional regulator
MDLPPAPIPAGEFARHSPGQLIQSGQGEAWKDLLVEIYTLRDCEQSVIIPAVAEPAIVWELSGRAEFSERELGGAWWTYELNAGEFFITTSRTPYELRWKVLGDEPFQSMRIFIGLPIFARAYREVFGQAMKSAVLREVSGGRDPVLEPLLEQLRRELTEEHPASPLFVQGLAQSLAVHLIRTYSLPGAAERPGRPGLPACTLRKVMAWVAARLGDPISVEGMAREAGLSPFHFSRLFKQTTGFTPSHYVSRERMEKARGLLRETDQSVIEIALEVGYASPGHFAKAFRRETGMTPVEFRRQG